MMFQEIVGLKISKLILYQIFIISFYCINKSDLSAQYNIEGKDPLEWQCEPHSVYSKEIFMSVKPVCESGNVEYSFECIEGGGVSSGWQGSNNFRVSGLKPQSKFKYIAMVRDAETGMPLIPATSPVIVTTRRSSNTENTRFMTEIDKAFEKGEIELIPIRITGDKDNRINFCVINRWTKGQENPYNSPELREEFIEDAEHAFRTFIPGDKYAIDPFPEYRDFFNLYAIWWPGMPEYDWENGMSPADLDEIRDRLFRPWNIKGKGWVSCLAMINSDGGGGGAARNIETRTGNAMIAGRETEAFIHEFSHTAPGLPDEYTSNGVWGRGGVGSNTELDFIRENVKWRAWIDPDTEVPTQYSIENKDKIGLFEGATHRVHHIYRPTARGCIMGAGSFAGDPDGLCPVCVQRAVCRFYMWVNPFDSIYPARKILNIKKPGTIHFAVDIIETVNKSQKLSWYLNGKLIGQGTSEMDISFGDLEKYELECRLTDESRFVRPDPPFVNYPVTSVKWVIINDSGKEYGNKMKIDLDVVKPVEGCNNGKIEIKVNGGTGPYFYEWDDGKYTAKRQDLGPGRYKVKVYDAEYRKIEKVIVLPCVEDFNPRIISKYKKDSWNISVEGVDRSITDFKWSDGVEGAERKGLPDGKYSCFISDVKGNNITRGIALKSCDSPFDAGIKEIIPSTGNMNNGSVTFDVQGGRKPYIFEWPDGHMSDKPSRDFLIPGKYSLKVSDRNQSVFEISFEIKQADAFYANDLKFINSGHGSIKISNPEKDYRYLWYKDNIPDYVPVYPNGKYYGTCITAEGVSCKAEATIVENRGGVFIRDTAKNDFGSWISLKIYSEGDNKMPVEFNLNTIQDGRYSDVLTIKDQKTNKIVYDDNYQFDTKEVDIIWNGIVENGYLKLTEKGFLNSEITLFYSSFYPGETSPVAMGIEFAPSEPGNYYVAAQDKHSEAISLNRIGIAVTKESEIKRAKPLNPSEVSGANMIMWLDADDLNADGKPDGSLFRRGSANGGRSKAGDVGFHWFNYFPNEQNGKPVVSWRTIWIQKLSREINNYQTIIMVRRESDYSSPGTAPWRELDSLIGTGPFGGNLFRSDLSTHIVNGTVKVNGKEIDPSTYPMPGDFYVVTYMFDKVLDIPFQVTDGHWEGDIGEVLVFDSELSDNELCGIEEYLYRKWISGVSY